MNLLDRSADAAVRAALSVISPAGHKARLSILTYHRVLPEADPFRPAEVDVETFTWQMRVVDRYFNVIPLLDAVRKLQAGELPARALCITFDDGYADNAAVALPILKQIGLPATFFVATAFLDGGRMWNDSVIEAIRRVPGGRLGLEDLGLGDFVIDSDDDRRAAISKIIRAIKYLPTEERQRAADRIAEYARGTLPDDLMMTRDELRSLSLQGMEVGAHTVNHPILQSVTLSEAQEEIAAGRANLEQITRGRVQLFAYPNGRRGKDYSSEHVDLVQQLGFTGAVSTNPGTSRPTDSPFELRRFTPWDRTPARFVTRMMLNCLGRAA